MPPHSPSFLNRYEDICPSTHNMDVPHVKREDYQLTDIDEDFLVLMSDGGDLREDLKIPEGDLGVQLKKEFDEGKELLVRIFFFFKASQSQKRMPLTIFNESQHFITCLK